MQTHNDIMENPDKDKFELVESDGLSSHFKKHKRKYLFGAGLLLAAGIGYHIGNRGNSKRHYERLLKQGVQGAVEDGIRDVVQDSMKAIVKDGMKDVVQDVMDAAIFNDIELTVAHVVNKNTGDAVKKAIKESGVTILREVVTSTPKQTVDTDSDDLRKVVDYILKSENGIKIKVDENGNLYTAKHTV